MAGGAPATTSSRRRENPNSGPGPARDIAGWLAAGLPIFPGLAFATGEPGVRWDDDDLDALKRLRGSDFEFVFA